MHENRSKLAWAEQARTKLAALYRAGVASPSAQRWRQKKDGEDQAIGRSRGGLSTKIHTLVDALGNAVGFSDRDRLKSLLPKALDGRIQYGAFVEYPRSCHPTTYALL